jgi:hypothetical protein
MGSLTAYVPKLPSSSRAFELACNQGVRFKIKRLMLQAWDDPDGFRALVEAIDAKGSVHGSLAADNVLAAQHIQKLAEDMEGFEDVVELNLAQVVRQITAILDEGGLSRARRRAIARAAAEAA